MKTIHVLDTAPWRAALGDGAVYEKDSVEFLTMLLAALEWKETTGRVELYTDRAGEAWAIGVGLHRIYNRIAILPELKQIDRRRFWDIGKAVALEIVGDNAAVADTDLVYFGDLNLLQTNLFRRPIIGHFEPVEWECYQTNRSAFEGYGFDYGWDWSAPPVNVCLLSIPSEWQRFEYVRWALNAAVNISRNPPRDYVDAGHYSTMFASQQILGMLLKRWQQPVRSVFTLRTLHHEPTDNGFHLWGRKDVYREWLGPRVVMLNWLRAKIEKHGDEAIALLRINNLFRDFTERGEKHEVLRRGRAPKTEESADNAWTRTVTTVEGRFTAVDPCTRIERELASDRPEKIYRGDVVSGKGQLSIRYNDKYLATVKFPEETTIDQSVESKIWAFQH